jgi:hypothetical protein
MDSGAQDPIPGSDLTPEEILAICRTNVEALHNLHYLMKLHVAETRLLTHDLGLMELHLKKMTDELCRKS